jgi:hypothetical protein
MVKKKILEKTIKEAFILETEKIIHLLAQEISFVLKSLRYRFGKVATPGIREFSKKDVLMVILDELKEVKWELESVKKRLRGIEKTLEERKIQVADTELGVKLKQSLWGEDEDNEDGLFLFGEG